MNFSAPLSFYFLIFVHLSVPAYFFKKVGTTNTPEFRTSSFAKRNLFSKASPMLKHRDTHSEYQHFISEAMTLLNPSQHKKLTSMSDFWNKLSSLNPNPTADFLHLFTLIPEDQPLIPHILRLFILIFDRKFIDLTK